MPVVQPGATRPSHAEVERPVAVPGLGALRHRGEEAKGLTVKTAETIETTEASTDDGDSLSHWHCCLEDRALCGARLTGELVADGEEVECVVCRAMEDQPCEVTCDPWLT